MPKLRVPEDRKRFLPLSRLVNGAVATAKLSNDDVGAAIGKSRETARTRLMHPEEMSLKELVALSKKADIPIDELRSAIRY